MISLRRQRGGGGAGRGGGRLSVRDRLLPAEVQELQAALPATMEAHWPDPDLLACFTLTVRPDEGFWLGGLFRFSVRVTDDYNMAPPEVKCLTKIWHPNISVDGDICLSLLRQNSIDEMGWAPTRKLKDVAWGLNSLFTDLLNFDDPLNISAADMFQRDKEEFINKVKAYMEGKS